MLKILYYEPNNKKIKEKNSVLKKHLVDALTRKKEDVKRNETP